MSTLKFSAAQQRGHEGLAKGVMGGVAVLNAKQGLGALAALRGGNFVLAKDLSLMAGGKAPIVIPGLNRLAYAAPETEQTRIPKTPSPSI